MKSPGSINLGKALALLAPLVLFLPEKALQAENPVFSGEIVNRVDGAVECRFPEALTAVRKLWASVYAPARKVFLPGTEQPIVSEWERIGEIVCRPPYQGLVKAHIWEETRTLAIQRGCRLVLLPNRPPVISAMKTPRGNVEVLNETIDYYRYFDATPQAGFLFECVAHTLEKTIPEELRWLQKHDAMETWLAERFQMPGKSASLLIRFLEQNGGVLSKRVRTREFATLSDEEAKEIEGVWAEGLL